MAQMNADNNKRVPEAYSDCEPPPISRQNSVLRRFCDTTGLDAWGILEGMVAALALQSWWSGR